MELAWDDRAELDFKKLFIKMLWIQINVLSSKCIIVSLALICGALWVMNGRGCQISLCTGLQVSPQHSLRGCFTISSSSGRSAPPLFWGEPFGQSTSTWMGQLASAWDGWKACWSRGWGCWQVWDLRARTELCPEKSIFGKDSALPSHWLQAATWSMCSSPMENNCPI